MNAAGLFEEDELLNTNDFSKVDLLHGHLYIELSKKSR